MTKGCALWQCGSQNRALRPYVTSRSATFAPFTDARYAGRRQAPIRSSKHDDATGGDGGLASVFNRFVTVKGITSPVAAAQRAHPSPLIPPTAVLEQAMTVLQRNDWPDADAGVLTAFHLTLPAPEDPSSVRSWRAEEEWLPWPRFHAQLHVAYGPMLNCDSWRVASPLVFPSSRHDNKAVQAVEVRAAPRRRPQPQGPQQQQQQAGTSGIATPAAAPAGWQLDDAEDADLPGDEGGSGLAEGGVTAALRSYTFTFCLERQATGPFKDCWLIAGVRVGNYAL